MKKAKIVSMLINADSTDLRTMETANLRNRYGNNTIVLYKTGDRYLCYGDCIMQVLGAVMKYPPYKVPVKSYGFECEDLYRYKPALTKKHYKIIIK